MQNDWVKVTQQSGDREKIKVKTERVAICTVWSR